MFGLGQFTALIMFFVIIEKVQRRSFGNRPAAAQTLGLGFIAMVFDFVFLRGGF